jgi:hypothetical protein
LKAIVYCIFWKTYKTANVVAVDTWQGSDEHQEMAQDEFSNDLKIILMIILKIINIDLKKSKVPLKIFF